MLTCIPFDFCPSRRPTITLFQTRSWSLLHTNLNSACCNRIISIAKFTGNPIKPSSSVNSSRLSASPNFQYRYEATPQNCSYHLPPGGNGGTDEHPLGRTRPPRSNMDLPSLLLALGRCTTSKNLNVRLIKRTGKEMKSPLTTKLVPLSRCRLLQGTLLASSQVVSVYTACLKLLRETLLMLNVFNYRIGIP